MRTLIDGGEAGTSRALLLLGEAGIGKTALLADLAGHGRASGLRVLVGAGLERESTLPLAGVQRLLSPVLAEHLTVPGWPDAPLTGDATRELLTRCAGPADRVLMLVDDAQWMDTASLEALAFAAHRLDQRKGALVFAARGDVPPAGLAGIAELRLGPLSAAEAGELLDAQPQPPHGRNRVQVLGQAAGNPLALTEMCQPVAADPPGHHGPLPLTARLGAVFGSRLGGLPAQTRHSLLLVAVADDTDLAAVTHAAPSLDLAALGPAEELGLITVDATGARFRHPLIRSAVYHNATFAARAAAHREVAGVLRDQPDRRAWHLAAASLRPDERIASLLVATAPQAQARGGISALAAVLERAAELSPQPDQRATRQVIAAEAAAASGQTGWARDLAASALLRQDARLWSRAQHVTGRALAWSGRFAAAADILLPLARDNVGRDADAAWSALALAATAAYQAGAPEGARLVSDALAELPPPATGETRAARAWALAATGKSGEAEIILRRLSGAGGSETFLAHAGAAAWLADQTSRAIDLLQAARNAQAEPQARAISGGPLAALCWACLDAGRWDEALEYAADAWGAGESDISRSTYRVIAATIEAARGEIRHARALIAAALAASPEHSRLIAARARHALGLCALSDGDYQTAFELLRGLFGEDGTALHYHASYLAVGDLALAAARSGHRLEGREALKRIAVTAAHPDSAGSPRLRQQFARASGLLADPATAGPYSAVNLDDQSGSEWPFERAQLCLEFGEWLRRRRRINEAKPVLGAALEAFQALRARPWEDRARRELRAGGVVVPGALSDASRLWELTPQQRQIIGLAAQGLSNQEIAERLFLSPRTVSSHLYRSFPKLGVAGRRQLHRLFAQPSPPAR